MLILSLPCKYTSNIFQVRNIYIPKMELYRINTHRSHMEYWQRPVIDTILKKKLRLCANIVKLIFFPLSLNVGGDVLSQFELDFSYLKAAW